MCERKSGADLHELNEALLLAKGEAEAIGATVVGVARLVKGLLLLDDGEQLLQSLEPWLAMDVLGQVIRAERGFGPLPFEQASGRRTPGDEVRGDGDLLRQGVNRFSTDRHVASDGWVR
jgi:hypothetical protein